MGRVLSQDDEGSHRMDLLVSCATYSALVAIDEEWVDQGALQRMLEARGHRPTGIMLSADGHNFVFLIGCFVI